MTKRKVVRQQHAGLTKVLGADANQSALETPLQELSETGSGEAVSEGESVSPFSLEIINHSRSGLSCMVGRRRFDIKGADVDGGVTCLNGLSAAESGVLKGLIQRKYPWMKVSEGRRD